MAIKLILFDLDGTLMNTLEDLTDSTNHILTINNFPTRTIEEIRTFVGNGIRKLIERAVPENTSESIIEKCYQEMIIYYKEHSLIKTSPYSGVKELIKSLHSKGIKIGIITNKAQNSADVIVDKFFKNSIDLVIGDNNKFPLKPNPDSINEVIKYFNVSKNETIYIGDSEVDLLTGKNADVKTIAVLWGFRDKEFLIKKGGKIFAKTSKELEKLLETF
ncbi:MULTISPECIES: HAD family hydrolase [Fusobacterium]|uniref:HAD family hydrolase n=1 Tax=Fusobacterium TaxID=848 RepID=UPI001476970A|nr:MULTISPECIES: HAD family hydrolase [Fusobacterium]NME35454.1 HAD family hydrolase [Fusobacterium sp. FSA-380-WT-3A]